MQLNYDGKYYRECNNAIEDDLIKQQLCELAGLALLKISNKDEEKVWRKIKSFF